MFGDPATGEIPEQPMVIAWEALDPDAYTTTVRTLSAWVDWLVETYRPRRRSSRSAGTGRSLLTRPPRPPANATLLHTPCVRSRSMPSLNPPTPPPPSETGGDNREEHLSAARGQLVAAIVGGGQHKIDTAAETWLRVLDILIPPAEAIARAVAAGANRAAAAAKLGAEARNPNAERPLNPGNTPDP